MPSIINATTASGLTTSADNSGSLQLATNNGTTAVTIDTSQNVGIGTSSPASFDSTGRRLVVGTGSGDQGMTIFSGSNNANIFFASGTTGAQLYNGYIQYQNSGNNMLFGTNATERMRIASGGNVGIGTTAVTDQRLNVVDGGTLARIFRAAADSGSFAGVLIEGYGARTTTNGSYTLIDVLNGNVTGRFRVLDSGNAQNTNSSYGGLSDIRLKENIVDATPKLADLCKVKVRHYNFKNKPNEKQIGVIAQELEEVFAGLVEETADKDAEGNDLGTTTKSVKYSVFVPMLIKAMQEQQQIINDLKTSVEAQAVRIAELEGAK